MEVYCNREVFWFFLLNNYIYKQITFRKQSTFTLKSSIVEKSLSFQEWIFPINTKLQYHSGFFTSGVNYSAMPKYKVFSYKLCNGNPAPPSYCQKFKCFFLFPK